MAANPIPLSGLARRLVEDNLLDEETAKSAAEEAQKTRVPFVTHLVQSELVAAKDIATSASDCLLYTSPSPRDKRQSRMPSSA